VGPRSPVAGRAARPRGRCVPCGACARRRDVIPRSSWARADHCAGESRTEASFPAKSGRCGCSPHPSASRGCAVVSHCSGTVTRTLRADTAPASEWRIYWCASGAAIEVLRLMLRQEQISFLSNPDRLWCTAARQACAGADLKFLPQEPSPAKSRVGSSLVDAGLEGATNLCIAARGGLADAAPNPDPPANSRHQLPPLHLPDKAATGNR
jgi:hypothetical protein